MQTLCNTLQMPCQHYANSMQQLANAWTLQILSTASEATEMCVVAVGHVTNIMFELFAHVVAVGHDVMNIML